MAGFDDRGGDQAMRQWAFDTVDVLGAVVAAASWLIVGTLVVSWDFGVGIFAGIVSTMFVLMMLGGRSSTEDTLEEGKG